MKPTSLQRQFIDAIRATDPAITQATIARLIGVSRQSVSAGEFALAPAIERWNQRGGPTIRVVPASIEIE